LRDAEVDADCYTQVHLMPSRILTVPNQLTFLRLAFLPVFLIAIEYERYDLALGILVAAGVSDALDGVLARGLNQRTPLGAYLDPIADKLLLSSSYFILALKGKIAWWLTILVLGKATTFFEILLVVLVLVLAIWDNQFLWVVRHACTYLVAVFLAISGLHYSIVVSRQLHAGV
jgi:cardiolipin synthase